MGPTSAAAQNERCCGRRACAHRLRKVRNDRDRPQERRQRVRGWHATDQCASSSQPVNRLENEAKETGEPLSPTPRCPAHPAGRYSRWLACPNTSSTHSCGVSRASTASRAVGRTARARARAGQEGRAGGVHDTGAPCTSSQATFRTSPDACARTLMRFREGPRPPAHSYHASPRCAPPHRRRCQRCPVRSGLTRRRVPAWSPLALTMQQ